jgi:precorrin-6A/cobalt-precorrin-6A reductase
VRVGGFGGTGGLIEYLRRNEIDSLIDATHPFAVTISAHAVAASREVGCRLIVVNRPRWIERPDDNWYRVPDVSAAAAYVETRPPGVVFLTVGQRDTTAFAGDLRHDFLIRMISAPEGNLPARTTLLLARGPYRLEAERELMHTHRVGLLVTKESGGACAPAKLAATRQEGIPVLVINRPTPPPAGTVVGTVVESVQEALGLVAADVR